MAIQFLPLSSRQPRMHPSERVGKQQLSVAKEYAIQKQKQTITTSVKVQISKYECNTYHREHVLFQIRAAREEESPSEKILHQQGTHLRGRSPSKIYVNAYSQRL